jgi:predicted protein tyrosine phosphatase
MNLEPYRATEPQKIKEQPMALEQKPWYADLLKQFDSLWYGIAGHGPKEAFLGTMEILSRWIRGAPVRRLSEISPDITISGQYQKHGWKLLAKRGITSVINMRTEWDDQAAGIAPPRYMHLKVIDNTPPTLEMLQAGVDFIKQEVSNGGKVYIHCAAGVGRAPTMGAAYLISTGMSPDDAINHIRKIRPFIRPTPDQIAQLHAYAEKLKKDRETMPEKAVKDVAKEIGVSTAKPESTVPVASEAPIKPVAPVGTGEAVKAGIPETVGAAPAPVAPDPAPQGTVVGPKPLTVQPDIKAKDISQKQGGAKPDGSSEKDDDDGED